MCGCIHAYGRRHPPTEGSNPLDELYYPAGLTFRRLVGKQWPQKRVRLQVFAGAG